MSELSGAAILLLILLGGSALGVFVRRFLSERHRSPETNDLIRLVVTMLVTFAALVLGLLTSSVKASFDTVDTDLRGVAIQLIQLDRSLRIYGSETLPARICCAAIPLRRSRPLGPMSRRRQGIITPKIRRAARAARKLKTPIWGDC